MTRREKEKESVSGGNRADGGEGSRVRERLVGEGGSKERGWRVPRQRFCSSARRRPRCVPEKEKEKERERECCFSRKRFEED